MSPRRASIPSEGDAGRVIGAVGSYVVGGNYVIGFIVFLILIVVQYGRCRGAQRVSEVAARFTLDSMPGQQMSIDADLNMVSLTRSKPSGAASCSRRVSLLRRDGWRQQVSSRAMPSRAFSSC